MKTKRIIIGITGASGAAYGVEALKILRDLPDYETHLIISDAAALTIDYEMDIAVDAVKGLADKVYGNKEVGASPASGSFKTEGMLISPCTVKTLSAVANCHADTLIARTADVHLKERRRLVLMFRETPLHAGHIRLMDIATQSGAIIMPPMPALYHKPESVMDIIRHSSARALSLLGVESDAYTEWQG